jgi:uncharacterized protein (TIGR03546 family)
LRALNSNANPRQIATAMALGMVLGLTPLFSLHNLLIVLLVFILRINLGGLLLSFGLFSGFAYILDPLFHQWGQSVLTAASLNGLWTELYNNAFWRLTSFNNTIVMGSLLFSLILFFPLLFLLSWLIERYRQHLMKIFEKLHLTKLIKLLTGISSLGRN